MIELRDTPEARAELAAAWAVAGAMLVLPFLANLPIDFDKVAPLVLLPAWWLLRQRFMGFSVDPAQRGDGILLILVAAVTGVSLLGGSRPAPALVMVASWIVLLSGSWTVRTLAARPAAIRIVMGGIASGAALGCLAIWLTWQEGTALNAFPHYGHGRLFGLHMMMGTLSGIAWLVLSAPRSTERWAAAVIATLACGGMLWSGSRSPLIGVGVAVAVWWLAAGRRERHCLLRWCPAVFAAGLALSFFQWSPEPYLGWWNAIGRSVQATSLDELSSTRMSFWQVATKEILEAPLVGHSPDHYRFIVPKQVGNQPHNWVLQLLLDVGILGAVPFIVLLARQFLRGWQFKDREDANQPNARLPAAAILAGGLAAGLFDGVLYHAVALIPLTLVACIAGSSDQRKLNRSEAPLTRWRWRGTIVLAAALCVLGLHSYLVAQQLSSTAPSGPRSPAARLLRAFPSTTFGMEHWLKTWRPSEPDAALEWCLWAQHHSDNPAPLHVYAAVLLSNRADFAAANVEIENAMAKAYSSSLEKILPLRDAIHDALAEQNRPGSSTPERSPED